MGSYTACYFFAVPRIIPVKPIRHRRHRYMGRWQFEIRPPNVMSGNLLLGNTGDPGKLALRTRGYRFSADCCISRGSKCSFSTYADAASMSGNERGSTPPSPNKSKRDCPGSGSAASRYTRCLILSRHPVRNPGDDHPAIAVPDENQIPEILRFYQGADLFTMIGQVVSMLICKRWRKGTMTVFFENGNGPVPVLAPRRHPSG